MNINDVKKYMESCLHLKGAKININCLGGKPGSYSIEQIEHESILKKYCDGGSLRQFCFVFAMRGAYDENIDFNSEAAEHFESISSWIEIQNKEKNFPKINDTLTTAEGIEVVSRGYVYDSSIDSMKFQMKIRLIYSMQEYPKGIVIADSLKGEEVII